MFQTGVTLEMVNAMSKNTLVEHLGIEVTEIGKDFIEAKMPVDQRTHQPMGLLHGGASVVLAETLGSIAGTLTLNNAEQHCVGLEINANHIKSARNGFVLGRTTPVHIGKRTQIWEIKITNDADELVCISRLTLAVIDKK
ncbi:hotdog fold thioesterase [Roseivirga misakiensis]|uniref:Thioesterase n=1 Tax=Roseivirga misakiensis TaxID=1563681 RepID=A0A1E5T132_9BACT|nr:hotdog fold thioesterase [Roseivirga misakiensis]OEK05065.1 thioesterase [Roseivirga misakiensis]